MQVIIRAKKPQVMRSDVGQYDVLKNKLSVWVNSSRMMNGDPYVHVPDFEIPSGAKKLVLEDAGRDVQLNVPVEEFKSVFNKELEEYTIPWEDWYNKYRVLF